MKHLYYQILLGLREVIKYLEWLLFPSTKIVDPGNRYTRWILIFSILHDHPIVAGLINCIVENGLTINDFAKDVQRLYGDNSAGVLQGVRLPDMSIEEMMKILDKYERRLHPEERRLVTVLLKSYDVVYSVRNQFKDPITGTLYLVLCYAKHNNEFNRYIVCSVDVNDFVDVVEEPRCLKLGIVSLKADEFVEQIKLVKL